VRPLVKDYLDRGISRRRFMAGLTALGLTRMASGSVLNAISDDSTAARVGARLFRGTGGELLAEQLIASGVKYVFGNSGTGDAGFYEALVDRPQLQYVLATHEGPLCAMAAGYAMASGRPAYVCVSGMVGLANCVGQMFNAYKDQQNILFVAYKRESSLVSGRDTHEEVFDQELITEPFTKWRWIAKRASTIPEVVRRAFKLTSTPPHGPVHLGWNHDLLLERDVEAEIIPQDRFNVPMHIRPAADDAAAAAKLLLEAEWPIAIAGDDLYRAGAVGDAVRLAELLGMPVTTLESCFSDFPESHGCYVGSYAASMRFPPRQDVVINLGHRLLPGGTPTPPLIARETRFIDMRIDSRHLADVLPVDLPIVAGMKEGLADIIAAVEDRLTPALKDKIAQRRDGLYAQTARLRSARAELLPKHPKWNSVPIWPERLAYEVNAALDHDACVVDELSGAIGSLGYDPLAGKTRFASIGSHLGWGVGAAAGVKMARPDKQVVCLVGDGAFLFGPHALWTMARNEIAVIVVVFNNHAYNGTKQRALELAGPGRMLETGHMPHFYLGHPDINMAHIAKGFGVDGEVVTTPAEVGPAIARAIAATREGRPYVLDAQVARTGSWAESTWYPKLSFSADKKTGV
jgi:benzoylformate decarboxylase